MAMPNSAGRGRCWERGLAGRDVLAEAGGENSGLRPDGSSLKICHVGRQGKEPGRKRGCSLAGVSADAPPRAGAGSFSLSLLRVRRYPPGMCAAGAKPFAFPRLDAPRKPAAGGKGRRKPAEPGGPELLLYLHVPFCRRKCHYCAFASQVPESARDFEDYAQYVLREISRWKRALAGHAAASLYIGGGTPSLLPLPLLENIVFSLRKAFPFREGMEFSMEANPDSVADWEYLHGLLGLGVNRLSLGVQSFDDRQLLRLGRPHSGRQALAAFELIRKAGFANQIGRAHV